jgi:hypothetical protein
MPLAAHQSPREGGARAKHIGNGPLRLAWHAWANAPAGFASIKRNLWAQSHCPTLSFLNTPGNARPKEAPELRDLQHLLAN